MKLTTLGHGALNADVFATTLRAAGIAVAVDVRRFAGSRRHPQFGATEMRRWLGSAGIAYHAQPELGGRRMPLPDSPNGGLRNAGFRGYADYMAGPEFRTAFDELMALAGDRPTAIFCAETLWWQCHRRLIADAAVLLTSAEVEHLTPATRASHVLTPGVRRIGALVRYPPAGTAG